MKKGIYLLFTLASLLPLWSEPEEKQSLSLQFAYYPPHHQGESAQGFQFPSYIPLPLPSGFTPVALDQGRELGNTWGELKLQGSYKQRLIYPFLQGEGMLTKDNNLEAQIVTSISPVTLNLESRFILTPIAFLKLEAGGHMGTGWNLGFNGLGMNEDGSGIPSKESFPGIVLKGWGMVTFQMDAEAFWPGDWHHIVFSTDHKITYQSFSDAGENQAWQYEADSGQNFNGWKYKASYILGFQMPIKVNFVGFMVEPECYIGSISDLSPLSQGGWGSDFINLRMGPMMNINTGEKSSLLILLQAKNGIVYSDNSIHYNYFKNRSATDSSYWYWDRLALVYDYKF